MNVRTFISLPIPANENIIRLLNELKCSKNIKVTSEKNIHMTLCFIGDIDEKKIEIVKECVNRSIAGINSSSIELKGLSAFPNTRNPHIIWIGLRSDIPLKKISYSIGKELDMVNIGHDHKPFNPHITLGRMSGNSDISIKLEKYADMTFGTVYCDRILIMKSELFPSGAKYTILDSIELQ